MILAIIGNLAVKNRLRISLLNPQTTILTLDLQIVARVPRGGKPVPTSVPRTINQREKYLLFVGYWFFWGGILFRSCTVAPWARVVQLGLATVLWIIWGRGHLHQKRGPDASPVLVGSNLIPKLALYQVRRDPMQIQMLRGGRPKDIEITALNVTSLAAASNRTFAVTGDVRAGWEMQSRKLDGLGLASVDSVRS